jgi:hypothetical protein
VVVIVYNYLFIRCEFEYRLWRDVPVTTLCDKVCQWLTTGRWFSPLMKQIATWSHSWNIVKSNVKHHIPNTTLQWWGIYTDSLFLVIPNTTLQWCGIYTDSLFLVIPYTTLQWCGIYTDSLFLVISLVVCDSLLMFCFTFVLYVLLLIYTTFLLISSLIWIFFNRYTSIMNEDFGIIKYTSIFLRWILF